MNKQVELIKAEIERLYKENKERRSIEGIAATVQLSKVLNFINSLSEEPVSEDLEKAAMDYAKEEYSRKNPATLPDRCIGCYAPIMYAFRNGANWKEQQIMKKAVEWLYEQLNYGRMECGNIEEFINDFRKAMSNIKDE